MESEAVLAELMGRMRSLEPDHTPDGWPAVQMRDITALCDAIVALNGWRKDAALGLGASRVARISELEHHADCLARALDGYQNCCGEDHDRPKFDCPTCGEEEKVLAAYRDYISR